MDERGTELQKTLQDDWVVVSQTLHARLGDALAHAHAKEAAFWYTVLSTLQHQMEVFTAMLEPQESVITDLSTALLLKFSPVVDPTVLNETATLPLGVWLHGEGPWQITVRDTRGWWTGHPSIADHELAKTVAAVVQKSWGWGPEGTPPSPAP